MEFVKAEVVRLQVALPSGIIKFFIWVARPVQYSYLSLILSIIIYELYQENGRNPLLYFTDEFSLFAPKISQRTNILPFRDGKFSPLLPVAQAADRVIGEASSLIAVV